MARILTESRWEDIVEYAHEFDYVDSPGSGYAFDCDAQGNLQSANPNYQVALDAVAKGEMTDKGVVKRERSYRHPAVIACDRCDQEVVLDSSWLNTCRCGSDYDGNGSLLAPRSQWGEETGESLADILGPGELDY